MAAQQHGMVVLGHDGAVLRPAKLWNDTESAPDAEALVAELGGAARWAALTGSVPGPAFTVTKLAWLARVGARDPRPGGPGPAPPRLAHLAAVGGGGHRPGRRLGHRLLLRGLRLLLAEVLGLVGLDESVVPRLAGPSEAVGEWGRAAVAPGTGDNMAVALGVGLETGDVVVSVGTSGTVFALSDRPSADATGAVAGFADATGRFLPLVCTLNAARVTDAVARLLDVDGEGFDRLALAGPPGAGGLVLLPYLDGERTPNRPGATGVLSGLRSGVSRADLARAAVEGVVCGLLDGLDALGAAGVDTASGRLLLVGGGARSAAYRQVLADLSGRQVTVPDGDELAATGACVQAATLGGATAAEVAEAWALGGGVTVDPAGTGDRAAVAPPTGRPGTPRRAAPPGGPDLAQRAQYVGQRALGPPWTAHAVDGATALPPVRPRARGDDPGPGTSRARRWRPGATPWPAWPGARWSPGSSSPSTATSP